MPLSEAQAYFNRNNDVTAIEVFTDNPDNILAYRAAVTEAAGRPVFLVDWQLGQEIKLRREQFGICQPGQELPDRFDVEAHHHADEKAAQRTDHADRGARDQKDP